MSSGDSTMIGAGVIHTSKVQGRWLFRWRSYAPLTLLLYLIALEFLAGPPDPSALVAFQGAGFLLGSLGLVVRFWTAGQIPAGTSTRSTRVFNAASLNTLGPYSLVRHPLYLGSFLVGLGVALTAGRGHATAVAALFFWLYYERIVIAEEDDLLWRFGPEFQEWAARTRAVLPSLGSYRSAPLRFSWRATLRRDYPAIYAFVAATTALEITRWAAPGGPPAFGAGWVVYFGAGTAFYGLAHGLHKRTSLLLVAGR